jgi:NTE family protein
MPAAPPQGEVSPPLRTALVLGAGGIVGVAHHVGVLAALEHEVGFSHGQADVLIGTSAGSVVAAYLTSGWSTAQLMEMAPHLHRAAPGPIAGGPLDLFRRGVGSAYVLARASVRVPSLLSLPPVGLLRRAFPAGLLTTGEGSSILERDLPRSWPARQLWLAAYDLVRRRRVVLGRPGSPYMALSAAVQASCAIPGVYAPVRAGGTVLVDGGAWSLTNVDLVALSGCEAAICVAPMAYDLTRPPGGRDRLVREVATRMLTRSTDRLRRLGVKVVTIAPGPAEVTAHGLNLMRADGLDAVVGAAYEGAVHWLRRRDSAGELHDLARDPLRDRSRHPASS